MKCGVPPRGELRVYLEPRSSYCPLWIPRPTCPGIASLTKPEATVRRSNGWCRSGLWTPPTPSWPFCSGQPTRESALPSSAISGVSPPCARLSAFPTGTGGSGQCCWVRRPNPIHRLRRSLAKAGRSSTSSTVGAGKPAWSTWTAYGVLVPAPATLESGVNMIKRGFLDDLPAHP